jgi:hypothetical protein
LFDSSAEAERRRGRVCGLLNQEGEAMSVTCLILLASVPSAAPPVAQEWGDLKGQVVFDGDKIPENPKVNVTADRKHCLSKGPILQDKLVIDSKTKGVRWVVAYLAPVKDFRKMKAGDVPIHPSLRKVPKEVVVKAPCCKFEPRVLVMREGTTLVFEPDKKAVGHNVRAETGEPFIGQLVLPVERQPFQRIKARPFPISLSCSIHPWMISWVFTTHHPYAAVTDEQGRFVIKDAPAGRWRLVLWQEESGFFPFRNKNDVGLVIEVRRGKTTDVGEVKFTEPKD